VIQLKFKIEVLEPQPSSLHNEAKEILSQMDQQFNSMFNQNIRTASKNFELQEEFDLDL
jgi:hypothetical protein